jgi:ATP-binding cassette, subfamily C (CFTR/MRP), member 1
LLPLLPKDTPIAVFQRFKVAWKQQCDQFECPSLSMAFTIAVGRDFMIAGLIKLIHDSTLFVSPLLLNHIITFLTLYGNTTTTTTHRPSLSTGLFYVFVLFVANLIQSLCPRQYFYLCFRTGMNLSHCHDHCYLSENSTGSLAKKSAGEVTNLMAVDSSRLQELTPYLYAIWYSLYQIVLAMTFLWQQMGISCLAGITVIVCMIPVSYRVSSYMKSLQKQLSKIRDDRSKLTNEMLLSMKVIKIQSWEAQFHKKINKIREEELVALGK